MAEPEDEKRHIARARTDGEGGDGGAGDGAEDRKRVNLSMPQVVAGGVATLTAATAASYLGVYGTIFGAAVMSVISTAGTAVTQHWLERSGDKAKEAAARAGMTLHGARAQGATRAAAQDDPGGAAGSGHGPTGAADAPTHAFGTDGDAETTRALPTLGGADHADGADGTHGADGADGADVPDGDDERTWWQRYRMAVIPAAVVFVGVMLVILVFELLTGRSLTDTVHGRSENSSPSLLGGVSQNHEPDDGVRSTPTPGTEGQEGTGGQEDTDGVQPSPGTEETQGTDDGTGTDDGAGTEDGTDGSDGDTGTGDDETGGGESGSGGGSEDGGSGTGGSGGGSGSGGQQDSGSGYGGTGSQEQAPDGSDSTS